MGAHIVEGEFQSDKYPTCPRGKVPLSVKDPDAQDLLWEYAQRRRAVDAAFSDDLERCLVAAGYTPSSPVHECDQLRAARAAVHAFVNSGETTGKMHAPMEFTLEQIQRLIDATSPP